MTLQGFNSRRLQGLYRNLQAFGIGTIPARTLLSIAVSDDGTLFICDALNNKVLSYLTDGTKVDEWGTTGTSAGQLTSPFFIRWYDNEVYVADGVVSGTRLQVFSESGTYSRTIKTGLSAFDIYNGDIYSTDSTLFDYTPTFSKFDTTGTPESNFTITDIDTEVYTINYQTGVLTVSAIIPQDPDDSLEDGPPVYLMVYKFDDDGTKILEFNSTISHTSSQQFNYQLDNTTSDGIYFFSFDTGFSRISKHTTSLGYIDRNIVSNTPFKTWRGIVYYDSFLYLPTNYSDTSINSKVQVYRADTLDFDSEWTAT